MAKTKKNNKSHSLNDKNKAKNSAEAEFLKEEFANEYAEREMLIDDSADEPTTLKEVDAPPIDLAGDVNVDLSIALGDADGGDSDLQSIENITLDEGDDFSLQLEPEENDTDAPGDTETTEESTAVIPEVELTLEPEQVDNPPLSVELEPETVEPEVSVEINEDIVGFNFGEAEDEAPESEGSDVDESDNATVNLSDSLKQVTEANGASNDEATESDSALSDNDNLQDEKSKPKRTRKAKKADSEAEDDTTIVDAVAKEMEHEARQTLMQRTLLTDSDEDDEDEQTEEQEAPPVLDTNVVAEQATDEEITAYDEPIECSKEETQENKTNESDGKSVTPEESTQAELITEEEEYRRALAIRDKRLKKAKTVFDFIELLIFTLLAVLLVTTFFVRHSVVEGDSMLGTLEDGQSLLISDFMYKPECGDIIVVEDHSTQLKKPIVKRIIAVGGQTVKIARHGVYVDGVLLDEPYVFTDGIIYEYDVIPSNALLENETLVVGYNYYELVVPEGELFVMGDHRNLSMDSRTIGTVHEDAILGKVLVRIAPFSKFTFFK